MPGPGRAPEGRSNSESTHNSRGLGHKRAVAGVGRGFDNVVYAAK